MITWAAMKRIIVNACILDEGDLMEEDPRQNTTIKDLPTLL